jgi:HAD superfamily hydrolase (TIGR01549 family)
MNYNHIVFDIDNTLINTEYAVLHSLQKAVRETTSCHIPVSNLLFALGIPGRDALLQLGVTDSKDTLSLWDQYAKDYAYTSYVYDGIIPLLEKLCQNGYQLGIITSKTRQEFNMDFRPFGLGAYFDIVVCADDTIEHKPEAAPMIKYIELSNRSNEDILYIGDSIYDMQCASAASVDCGLAIWGSRSQVPVNASYYFNHPNDILDFLLTK